MNSAHDARHVDRPSVQDRTIFVDTTGISAIDFDLDPKTRNQLFTHGQEAAAKFLSNWNWENWQQTYENRSAGARR